MITLIGVFLQFVFFYVHGDNSVVKRLSNIDYVRWVSSNMCSFYDS